MIHLLAFLFFFASQAWAGPCDPSVLAVSDLGTALATAPQAAPAPVVSLAPDAFTSKGLRKEVLAAALKAFENAWAKGDTRRRMITVIDYSLPSNQRRLWVIDLEKNQVLFHEYVAHGRGSGMRDATDFSNKDGSHKSNLGLLKTAETYSGKHGYSLVLDGLEKGYNDHARSRSIVVHAADYVTEAVAKAQGRVGRSHGCPAVDPAVSKRLIDTIKGGTLVFGYYPDQGWLKGSTYLK